MAKKKVKKVKKEELPMIDNSGRLIKENLPEWAQKETVITLRSRVERLEQRIDRIVTAIGKAKSVKGL